jgi:hypothetical protein
MKLALLYYGGFLTNFYNFSYIVESIGRNDGVAFFSAILLKPLRDLAVYAL